jgi:hypothetical protein
VDGLTSPTGPGSTVATYGVEELLLLLLFVFGIFIVSFGAGETHVALIDAIFAKILLARYTLDQFVGFNFRPT